MGKEDLFKKTIEQTTEDLIKLFLKTTTSREQMEQLCWKHWCDGAMGVVDILEQTFKGDGPPVVMVHDVLEILSHLKNSYKKIEGERG